jgi:hypothetical protein
VEFFYVNGKVAKKFIHMMYKASGHSARATFDKTVATLSTTYGNPGSNDQTTATWLADPVFVFVSMMEQRGLVTVGIAHRAFDPLADNLWHVPSGPFLFLPPRRQH